MTAELDAAAQQRLVQALRRTLGGEACQCLETHISWVLVAAGQAWKFRKPLNLGFLDFTTLERRRHDCDEELRLNRRLAPAMYLGRVDVTGDADHPRLGGSGPVIDCAVQMRAFAQEDLWDRRAARGALGAPQVEALAALLAGFHRDAAVAPPGGALGSPAQVRAVVRDNLQALAPMLSETTDRERLAALDAWEQRAFEALAPVFARRLAEGRVRECHGDLHLGNVTEFDGRTTVFDCIEFNDDFRWIDVMSELAFMTMDLHAHRLPALAHRLLNAYLELSGDYAGLRVLPYYAMHRALVRAKVAAIGAAQHGGHGAAPVGDYVVLAQRLVSPGRPLLALTHGLSGSGKTRGTQARVDDEGAVRVRADVERKRLHGLAPLARSTPAQALYTPEATRATYARLCDVAGEVLAAGWPVVLDATFLQRWQRDAAREVARRQGVPAEILHFEADEATLRQRLRQRANEGGDASEADEAVLALQQAAAEPLQADELAITAVVRPPES